MKIELLELFVKRRLDVHNHEVVAIGVATEWISHYISFAWSVRDGKIVI